MPVGCGGEGSCSTDFVPLEFPDAGAVEAERGNTRWDANGSAVNAHGDKGSVLRAHSSGKGPPKAPHSSLGVCLHVRTAASAHDLQPKSPAHSSLLVLTMEKGLPFSPDSPMA